MARLNGITVVLTVALMSVCANAWYDVKPEHSPSPSPSPSLKPAYSPSPSSSPKPVYSPAKPLPSPSPSPSPKSEHSPVYSPAKPLPSPSPSPSPKPVPKPEPKCIPGCNTKKVGYVKHAQSDKWAFAYFCPVNKGVKELFPTSISFAKKQRLASAHPLGFTFKPWGWMIEWPVIYTKSTCGCLSGTVFVERYKATGSVKVCVDKVKHSKKKTTYAVEYTYDFSGSGNSIGSVQVYLGNKPMTTGDPHKFNKDLAKSFSAATKTYTNTAYITVPKKSKYLYMSYSSFTAKKAGTHY